MISAIFIDMCREVFFEENFDKIHAYTFPSLSHIFQLDPSIFDYFPSETNFGKNFFCNFNKKCLQSIIFASDLSGQPKEFGCINEYTRIRRTRIFIINGSQYESI